MQAECKEAQPAEWMAKLLNICMILGSLELFVIVNEKQQKEGAMDINLQAYARINPKKVIEQLLRVKTAQQGQMLCSVAEEEEIRGYIVSQVLYLLCICWGVLFE